MQLVLLMIVALLPIIGFISMLDYARKGATLAHRRQRKRHGLLFWVLLPAIAGIFVTLSVLKKLPDVVAPVTIIALAAIAVLGSQWQRNTEDREPTS